VKVNSALREQLFQAIDEDQFERIPAIAAAYRKDLLATGIDELEVALRPLNEALLYLRVVRAHQSLRFQKLSADALYDRYLETDCVNRASRQTYVAPAENPPKF
jgi:hypothetical protein